ncbi:MAG: helicase-related protein, partial [Bacteroidales bacterium]
QKNFLLMGGDDGEQVVAYQNTKELSQRLSPYIVRLTKKEVAPYLKDKQYKEIYFDLSPNQYKAYQAINGLMESYGFLPKNKQYQLGTFSQKLASGYTPTDDELQSIFGNLGKLGDGASNVNRIGAIAYQSENPRMLAIKQLITDLKERQCLIWCNFIDEMNAIKELVPKSAIINGSTPLKERTRLTKLFKQGKLQHLIISIAINEGLNLQDNCNTAIFYTDNYSRTKGVNAEDRIHRIGQTQECTIYKLIARNSLDERIKRVRSRKDKICNIFDEDSYITE